MGGWGNCAFVGPILAAKIFMLLDDKDEFRNIGIFANLFLEEAQSLIGTLRTMPKGPKRRDWHGFLKGFLIRSDGIITPAINAALGRDNVPR